MWDWLVAAVMMFPNVQARDLDGHAIQTDALRGAPIAYLLGFTYQSRFEVEAWEHGLRELSGGHLRVIEMPIYGGFARVMRPFIDQSMARNTPPAAHANVMTSTDGDTLVRALGLATPERACALVLVDARGRVLLVERGRPTPDARLRVERQWRLLASS